MSVTSSIKAMPTIADANGDLCVSQAAVLALLEAKAEEWRNNAGWMTPENPPGFQSGRIGQYRNCAYELAGERLSAERGT